MTNSNQDLERLELKVNALLILFGVQAVVLTVWFLGSVLLPSTSTLFMVIVVLAVVGFMGRKWIPGWSASVFRFVVQRLSRSGNDKSA